MKSHNLVIVFLALLIVSLFMPGCTVDTQKPTPIATSQNSVKILRINNQIEPATVDPQQVSQVREIAFGGLAFEALFKLNEKGEAIPAAADNLQVSTDGLTYTVTLKSNLKYSDGTPLTAYNFEYAFHRLFDPTLPGRAMASIAYVIQGAKELSEFQNITDTVALRQLQEGLGVKAINDKTIVFKLKSPAAYFPYILASPVGWPTREDLVKKGGPSWSSNENGIYYIGNGPFVLRQWDHGHSTSWEANPNYREGRPNIDRIEMQQISDFVLSFEAYKNGELDVVSLASENLNVVKNDAVLRNEFESVTGSTGYFAFNVRKPPFDNVKVRQAIASALDRDDYVAVVLNGAGLKGLSLIPPNSPGYEADVKQLDLNPEKAKQLLAEAGYPGGKGLPLIKLTYPTNSGYDSTMEWLQNQLQKNLGIETQLDPVEGKSYGALFKNQDTIPQIWSDGWSQNYPDPQDWLSVVFRSDAQVLPTGWKNQMFDDLTIRADGELDKIKRLELYKQAQQILVEESPVVFLNWYVNGYLIKPYVKGMKEYISPNDFTMPGFTNIVNIDLQP